MTKKKETPWPFSIYYNEMRKRKTKVITHLHTGCYLPCLTTKLARSPLKAKRRPKVCLGRLRVAHRTFWPNHEHHEVLNMFKTVAQRSLRRSVAHSLLKGGRGKAHASLVAETMHRGKPLVTPWQNVDCCKHCISISAMLLPSMCHHCAFFGRPIASIEWSPWRTLYLHSATMTTLGWATMAMVLSSHCLLCLTICATTAILVVQWRHTGHAAAITQKQIFLDLGDHWVYWWLF